MPRANFIKSTPFKLAGLFLGLILIILIIGSLVIFDTARRDFRQVADARLNATFETLSKGNSEDRIKTLKLIISAQHNNDQMFLLRDAAGQILVSNMPNQVILDGFDTVTSNEMGVKDDHSFRLLGGDVGDQHLVIAAASIELEELGEALLEGFFWAFIVAIVMAVTGGLALAKRAGERILIIETAMNNVANGDLQARIPLVGSHDDIDRISGHINQALEKLSRSVEGMRQVSTDIAHDLKTPLGHLKHIIEEALTKSETGLGNSADLEAALAKTEQINETFSALLRISQIESGARKDKFKPTSLNAILANVTDIYSEVAVDAGMSLEADISTISGAMILGDSELLTQLFVNLIENSIRHCSKGSFIRCHAIQQAQAIIVTIADNGPGIPEAQREKVLQRLYRLEQSRTTAGSGLGLSLVKAIADLHDAELILSDNAPGLAVTLKFPIQA